jgi:pSer/pThr/pTyr-binding forkhead associated (FHA) protein
MARLVITSNGFRDQVIELKLGVNRFGRTQGNDVQIEHPTISAHHCEITLGEAGIFVRDCGSTNGTFIDDEPVADTLLVCGQTLRIGDVQLFVENTEVKVAIPKFDLPVPAPPVVLTDGSLICPRHPEALATHQCTHCREVLCDQCVHRLKRRGGKLLKLCPFCSHNCEPLGGEKKRKKSFLSFLQKTVKLPFLSSAKKGNSEED